MAASSVFLESWNGLRKNMSWCTAGVVAERRLISVLGLSGIFRWIGPAWKPHQCFPSAPLRFTSRLTRNAATAHEAAQMPQSGAGPALVSPASPEWAGLDPSLGLRLCVLILLLRKRGELFLSWRVKHMGHGISNEQRVSILSLASRVASPTSV